MTKLQACLTILFALFVMVFAFTGLAKLSAIILAIAMIASMMTVFVGLSTEARPLRTELKASNRA